MEKRFPNHPHLRRLLLCSQGPLSTSRVQRVPWIRGCSVHCNVVPRFSHSLCRWESISSTPKGSRGERAWERSCHWVFPNYGENALVYGRMIISTQSDPWKDHKFGLPHISVFNLFFQAFLTRSLDRFLIKFCLILQVFVIQIFSDIF